MTKKLSVACVFAVLLALCLGRTAWAQDTAVPGRSAGRVFLGMDRADVLKILHKPSKSRSVQHGTTRYSDDEWISGEHTLSVVSEHDKVTQIRFNSPRMVLTDGLSVQSLCPQIRRRHRTMTVREYDVLEEDHLLFHMDDVRDGVAFTMQMQAYPEPDLLKRSSPNEIIIHRPGVPAVPIEGGHWRPFVTSSNEYTRLSLSLMQRYFTWKELP